MSYIVRATEVKKHPGIVWKKTPADMKLDRSAIESLKWRQETWRQDPDRWSWPEVDVTRWPELDVTRAATYE